MTQLTFLVLDFCVFAVVAFAVLVASRRVETAMSVRRRLQADQSAPRRSTLTSPLMKKELTNSVLQWVQSTALQDPEARSKLRRDLALAGWDSAAAPPLYVLGRFVLAIGLPSLFVVSQMLSAKPIKGFMFLVIAAGLAVVGLIAPRGILDNRANARKTEIEHEFPDALDLLVVCVESGLGLEGAIVRVASETHESHPRISKEFDMVSLELQAGRTRAEALRNMSERTQVEMIASFVALLIQTDALGGSIATTLRTYSAEMRQHRMLKAEEKAMRLPVLLTIPLVLFILPVIMMAVMLPPVIDGIRTFLPTMNGITR
ncbi:MAG TPA: type II secretion system F family protein [Caulobacteraceae bacterium]|jgi:tight adherence protein C|nr:type II secretion system F family protein [Caulobacteraceae bacterium]